MNGINEKGRYQFNWPEFYLKLYTTIDETGKRKGSIHNTIEIYFRCPFLLLPLLGILGESKAK